MPRKCVIVGFPHGVDKQNSGIYVVTWLGCFAKIFCARHENVSSVFRLADRTLEKQILTQENWS